MPPAARKAPALAPANDQRPVNARGQEYEAERLTGNRAQKGKLPGGEPCLTYEVVWKGNHRNTYEPAACLVGWEAEMKKVDEKYDIAALFPRINPAAEANKAREMAAKKKAEELKSKRERLMRLKARRERMGNAGVASDDDEEEEEEADQALGDEELAAELEALGRQLQMLTGGDAVAAPLLPRHWAKTSPAALAQMAVWLKVRSPRSARTSARADRMCGRPSTARPTGARCRTQVVMRAASATRRRSAARARAGTSAIWRRSTVMNGCTSR